MSVDASDISNKLSGLNWITPGFKKNPQKEINFINKIKSHLKEDNRSKMLLTNYSFFSAILNEKLFSPSFAIANDGSIHPVKGEKYIRKYKKLMIDIIEKNKILVIYIIIVSINYNYILN